MTGQLSAPQARALIRDTTRASAPPLVPEITLQLAAEPIGVWEQVEHRLGQRGLPPPFWAFAWPGGLALARYVLDHPATVQGRHVLDLASGSGVVAIAAAKAGAAHVTASDVDPLARTAIVVNAGANATEITVTRDNLLGSGGAPAAGADVVLVADTFYQRELAAAVLEMVARLHASGVHVLIGDPGRPYLPQHRFTPLATYDVPGMQPLEDSDVKRATVWVPR